MQNLRLIDLLLVLFSLIRSNNEILCLIIYEKVKNTQEVKLDKWQVYYSKQSINNRLQTIRFEIPFPHLQIINLETNQTFQQIFL